MVPFVAILAGWQDSNAMFDKIVATHVSMQSANVRVQDLNQPIVPTAITYNQSVGRMVMPNQQVVEVAKAETKYYDQIFDMVVVTKNDSPANPRNGLLQYALIHREPASLILDPNMFKDFMQDLKSKKGWKLSGNTLTLTKKNALSLIRFDKYFRLTQIKSIVGKSVLQDWAYTYPSAPSSTIPTSALKVKGLPERPTFPKNTKPKVKQASFQIWNAMAKVRNVQIAQQMNSTNFKTTYRAGSLSESGPKGSWTWNEGSIQISPKGKTPVTIRKQASTYLEQLRKVGIESSPFSRYIFNRQIPFLDLFQNANSITADGRISVNGKSADMVSIYKLGTKVRLLVDPSSHRIIQLSTDSQDAKGKYVTGSRLKLSYQ
jgi:hypothetical protein